MIKDAFIKHRNTEDGFVIHFHNQQQEEHQVAGYPVPGYNENEPNFLFCISSVPLGTSPFIYIEFAKIFKVVIYPKSGLAPIEYI